MELMHKEKPDIALIDVALPDISGIELTKSIRSNPDLSSVYIILISAFRTNSEQVSEGLEAGADNYIARPVNNRELLARVQAASRKVANEKALAVKNALFPENNNIGSNHFLSTLLVNMSYEIRTPLNGILGFTEMLKRTDLSGNEHQAFINIIENSGYRLLQIINKTIDFLQIETGMVETYVSESDVNLALEELYNYFQPEADKKGLTLKITAKIPEQQSKVRTDHQKVHTILSTLIQNAVKYTFKGGVEIGCICQNTGHQGKMNSISNYIFYVKDTGPGIPDEKQAFVFDTYHQAEPKEKTSDHWSGLSLGIAKAFAIKLGGDIWLESTLNKGSTFYCSIPRENLLQ